MTDEKKPAESKAPGGNAGNSTPKITRRRFTKAGVVAPVIVTLGSRPVWGQATCTESAAASFTHASHGAPCTEATAIVTRTASEWLKDAEQHTWPSGYPEFTVTPSSTFDELFHPSTVHSCSEKDVRSLMTASLIDVLGSQPSKVNNSRLTELARQATAAQLNSLFAQGLAARVGTTQALFPMTPDGINASFWSAILEDCGSSVGDSGQITLQSTFDTIESATTKRGKSTPSCDSYDEGLAMSLLASEFESLNQSGESIR